MKELNRNHFGLIIGSVIGLWHIIWSLLVLLGLAQTLIGWIFWLHFLNNPYQVEPFEFTRAVILVVVTFVVGYAVGWISAYLWNMLINKKK